MFSRVTSAAAVAAALALAAPVGASASPVRVETGGKAALSKYGIKLAPEESDAQAIVVSPPGETVTARITPAGCDDDSCRSVLSHPGAPPLAVGRAARRARARAAAVDEGVVIPLNGATVDRTSSATARASFRAIDSVRDDNVLCHGAGCGFWKMKSADVAFYDGNWAWGSRSRRGFAGWNDCQWSSAGYSWDSKKCNFINDPSKNDLYANTSGTVSAFVSGFPISSDKYIHQHVNLNGRAWVVSN
ncbi:hypothetical protein [Patulibacter defluvii]|uniref:hypothetical protein n=1 Tax=Patulibacter defluvii TaxID=3095358 RepID=UPI002A7623D7|nr:hypothetical protein [Patulibacter sp. DM4]